MNRLLLVGIGLIVLGGTGVFWYATTNSQSGSSSADQIQVSDEEETDRPPGVSSIGTLRDLIEAAMPVECDFSYETDREQSEGTIYVTGSDFRIDALTTVGVSDPVASSIIFSEEMYFAWGEANPGGEWIGLSFPVTKNGLFSSLGEPALVTTATTLESEASLECREWAIDLEVFSPPAYVSFFDPTAMFLPE